MLLLLTVFLASVYATDCSNKPSWGCDKIEDVKNDCYGAAAKFCGVCKAECQDGGGTADTTAKPEKCPPPKEPTCKVCTSDMDCKGNLFSITTYGEGSNGRFGCTYPETYEYVNESEKCPRGTIVVKKDAECNSGDEYVGWYFSKDKCAAAVAKKGGRFFIYGKSWKAFSCYMEKMETKECLAGWEDDKFDVYENILCQDDEEKVKKDMFDDNATCKNTISTYKSYGQDLCAPDSDFVRTCCSTCSSTGESASMIANREDSSRSFGVFDVFAVLGLGVVVYGAFKHYTK